MDKLMASLLMASLLLAASIALLFFGCSNKNSNEACQHKATMDLDKGNYDAVLSSSCTDSMQRGAAYFGKAGFDVKNVINTFSLTGSSGSSPSSQSNLKIYMTSLIGRVDEGSLTALDNSRTEYSSIPASADVYKDALFCLGLADTVKSLSLLKLVLNTDGSGVISTACDRNNNNKPDEVDAAGCALATGVGAPCPANTTVDTDSPNILITNATSTAQAYTGTYRGLVISVSGAGTNISGCPTSNEYSYLLYLNSAGTPTIWAPVVSAPGPAACLGSDGLSWPCPIIQSGQPIDLATSFDSGLTSAISSISTALQPSSGTTTTVSDIQTAIDGIKNDSCPSGICTASDIAGYLLTY